MAKDTNRLLGHPDEADGIDEYDNPLPDWWLGLLWLTVIWAAAYGIHYHFIANRSAVAELAAEMAMAEERWPQRDVPFELTAEAISAGEEIWSVNCVACHGVDMTGPIGPSLMDAEWLHGGTPWEIRKTVAEGVLTAGMPNWESILGAEAVNLVSAYVISQNSIALGQPLPEIPEAPPATP